MDVQLLDCTLRDGVHVNQGNFGHQHIISIINNLTAANLDIIEIGFLKHCEYSADYTNYPRIEHAYDLLAQASSSRQGVEYAVMMRADAYDIAALTECTGKIKFIRVAFYYEFLDGAIQAAKEILARGYSCVLNLINTPGSALREINELIRRANEIRPYAVTIVDTFGVLLEKELDMILNEYENNLDPAVCLGLHCHENLSAAYPLMQHFLNRLTSKRNICIDGSLMGMGRVPGNMCIEMAADYLNHYHGKKYDLLPILRSIEDDVAPIRKEVSWGYSPAYFLSARHRVHRSYSEYLLKKNYRLDQIKFLLEFITPERSGQFNKDYIEEVIQKYLRKS